MKYIILNLVVVTFDGGAFLAFRPLTQDDRTLFFDTKDLAVDKLKSIFEELSYDNSQYSIQEVYSA